eukprot:PhM_4_TR7287/c0_g1_i1/m.35406/K11308/MYST1, MOF, KAT8; histone acetyltransferase MYST1
MSYYSEEATTPTQSSSSQPPSFSVGQRVVAQQRGCQVWRNAVIQDTMHKGDGGAPHQYYVHWLELNKRLDEWVEPERIRAVEVKRKKQELPSVAYSSPQMITRRRSSQTPATPATPETPPSASVSAAQAEEASAVSVKRQKTSRPQPQPETRFDDKAKNISKVHLGAWTLEPWYFTPYQRLVAVCNTTDSLAASDDPPPVWGQAVFSSFLPEVYVCEFCLNVFTTQTELYVFHTAKCLRRCPPGTEIYRDVKNQVLVFEVDGAVQPRYCERLCLLSRMFLEHKCVDWDTSPFIFYVLCQYDDAGCHIVGYFSKEKNSPDGYNLACILVLPPYQSRGFGRVLIELSYCISKRHGVWGTPERPLSDLGLRTYQSYWKDILMDVVLMRDAQGCVDVSVEEMIQDTGMTPRDVVETLRLLGALDKSGNARLHITPTMRRDHISRKAYRKIRERDMNHVLFDPHLLRYDPALYEMKDLTEREFESIMTSTGLSTTPHTWMQSAVVAATPSRADQFVASVPVTPVRSHR